MVDLNKDRITDFQSVLPIDEYLTTLNTNPESVPADYKLGELTISCGPLIRFLATHERKPGNWRGTMMIVVRDWDLNNDMPCVTYKIGKDTIENNHENASDSEFNIQDGKCMGQLIYQEESFSFFRYALDFDLRPYPQKVKYYVNDSHLQHFYFHLPSVDQSMNILSYSCNGFSLAVDPSPFKGSLWLDTLRKHLELPFHVMIGGGDQIYADSIKKVSKEFENWLKHKHLHSLDKLTDSMKKSFDEYYLNHYMTWFGKGYWEGPNGKTIQQHFPTALACIPQINIYDDHDIIDGFGSYSDITMKQEIFQGLGKVAFKYYLLFQHHTTLEEETEGDNAEPSFIVSAKPGPYIEQKSRSVWARLGANIGFLGLDCRTERTKHEILSSQTYDIVFKRLEKEVLLSKKDSHPEAGKDKVAPNLAIKHLLVLLGVPIMYPRMVWLEKLMESPLSTPLKFLARHGIIAKGLVNEFDGQIELLDDLNDHWCAGHHKKERNKFLSKLVEFGTKHNIRITILSGDVHLACVSRSRSKSKLSNKLIEDPSRDPNLIFNIISSAIVNTPPPEGMAKFLKRRAIFHHFSHDVIEDMVPIFNKAPSVLDDGNVNGNDLFMARRNYSSLIPVENLKDSDRKTYGEPNGKLLTPGLNNNGLIEKGSKEQLESKGKNGDMGYNYTEDSLRVTIHVEQDRTNTQSKTDNFELFIPELNV
ncbi:hypothetical protein DAMA08_033340 [Martiniozyma asiatica (nom. inval.)]|nr:hypothetical protein DAMA08_033340 [Martiniozyma asiatica]